MRSSLIIFSLCCVMAECPAMAQTVPSVPAKAAAVPTTSAGTILQMQLQAAPARPQQIGGAEADGIYKRYIEGLGQPMRTSGNSGYGPAGMSSGRGAGQ